MADDELDPMNADRDRGVLTKRERRYLLGESDIEPKTQGERAVRQSIRNHLTHAILDFSILHYEMQSRDLSAIFESGGSPNSKQDDVLRLHTATPHMIALLYRQYGSEYTLERFIEDAIERERERTGDPVIADVSITVHEDRAAEIEYHLQYGNYDAIEPRDIEHLWRNDRLTDAEYLNTVERWEQWWKDTREERLERDKTRRQVVKGAFERAKKNVEYEQKQEEARQELLSEKPEYPGLTDATLEIMAELDSGDGVASEELIATVANQHDVEKEKVEQAIQDALLTGQCFEPKEGVLKPI